MPGQSAARVAVDADVGVTGSVTPTRASALPVDANLQVRLLGGFALHRGDAALSIPAAGRRLVALVALRDRGVSRVQAAGVLWGESSDERACGSVRTVLWALRKGGINIIDAAGGTLTLARDIDVDVRVMTSVANGLLAGQVRAQDVNLELFAEDLLPDWYDEWLASDRERLRQLRLNALEAMSASLVSAGQVHAAVQAALCAVASEPLRESANRVLIEAYLAEGNRADALRHFRSFAQLLSRELGLRPTQPLVDLVRAG